MAHLDKLLETLDSSRGTPYPEFQQAVQSLLDVGEPALHRLLQVIEGSVAIPSQNQFGWRAITENRGFVLMQLGKRYPDAFLKAVREGKRLGDATIVWALGSIADARVDALLVEALQTSSDGSLQFAAATRLRQRNGRRADELMRSVDYDDPTVRFQGRRRE